jgi:1-acyl-sn-glycerol-3-phosphate acyltransferase
MRTLLSIWGWLMVTLSAIIGFLIQLVLFILTLGLARDRILIGRVFRLSAVVSSRLIPFWHFRVVGEPPKKIGPMVVVSNHCSHADSFLISGLPWEMKWLGKSGLFNIPFVGWSMRLSGDIPIVRGDRASIEAAVDQCRAYLSRGVPVIIFPEGTRSETEDLLPFKDGAFRLAIEEGVPIMPVAVEGTRTALAKHDWRFDYSRARVTVGSPISTSGMTEEDIDSLMDQTRAAILASRAKIRVLLEAEKT